MCCVFLTRKYKNILIFPVNCIKKYFFPFFFFCMKYGAFKFFFMQPTDKGNHESERNFFITLCASSFSVFKCDFYVKERLIDKDNS